MCTRPFTKTFPPSVHDRLLGLASPRSLSLPCGKCAECLRKRQNSLSVRVYREAQKMGSACFVTLTYRPEDTPLASSLWSADRDSGEFDIIDSPSLITDSNFNLTYRHQIIESMRKKDSFGAICLETHVESFEAFDPSHDYIIRVTPTLYYEHVKLAMKRFRKKCSKKFTYVCVGEYGNSVKGFARPHYHLIFFGLQYKDTLDFCQEWPFGFTYNQQVNFVDKDGSDGLARVSRYVGKYCAKGSLDIYTVKQHCTLSDRLRSSKGLGSDLTQVQRDYFLAKDVCQYDENDPYSTLTSEQIPKVVNAIIERQYITFDGVVKFPLPSCIIKKLYGYQRTDTKGFSRPSAYKGKNLEIFEKAIYSPLFYLVADELRSRASEKALAELRRLEANVSSENLSSAVVAFQNLRDMSKQIRENSLKEGLLKLYSNSKV